MLIGWMAWGSCPTVALAQEVTEDESSNGSQLRIEDAPPFHETTLDIVDLRSISFSNSPAKAIIWDEMDGDGRRSSHYAISLDGQSVDTVRTTTYFLELTPSPFDPVIESPVIPENLRSDPRTELFLLQLATQPISEMIRDLDDAGVHLVQYVPNHAFVARIPAQSAVWVAGLPFVRAIVPFHPLFRVSAKIAEEIVSNLDDLTVHRYLIMIANADWDTKSALGYKIEALGGTSAPVDDGGQFFEVSLNFRALLSVISQEEVLSIDRIGERQVAMSSARELCGANYVEGVGGFTGQGVRGEVSDTELVFTHVAFQHHPPVLHGDYIPWFPPHGTSVYGTVFSDGTSGTNGRGILPEGQGIFATNNKIGGTILTHL